MLNVRVGEDLIQRVDEARRGQSRSDWVRGVIEAAVSSGKKLADEKPVDGELPARPFGGRVSGRRVSVTWADSPGVVGKSHNRKAGVLSSDARAVLEALRTSERAISSRALEQSLGWLGIRYRRAEGELIASGAVRYEAGLIEVVD